MADLNISTLGIVVKPENPLAPGAVKRVIEWGRQNSVEVMTDITSAKLVKGRGLEYPELLESIDALIVLGGDGTFLSAARRAKDYSVPLLGVNLGGLGFITQVSLDEVEDALNKLKQGNFEIEERMMIDIKMENEKTARTDTALNDVVLSRKNLAKMIELTITVNKQYVTRYKADGLIISSPTGSTAYALSAGGPILYPTIKALVVCPICPHTLSNRPLVIPEDSVIEVDLLKGQEEMIATLDGQESIDLNEQVHLTICRSEKVTRLLKVPERTHFDMLRSKLGWGGSSNYNV